MISKRNFIIITLFPIVALFFITKHTTHKIDTQPLVAVNYTKCISTKFLLNDIDTTKQIAPLFNDLGNHYYSISTKNERAQAFFNQGLNLTYAFNHAEAHRAFMEAARLDTNLAMAYWGQAYALGPNINDHVPDPERRLKSFEAIQKALKFIDKTSQKEHDLIQALAKRFPNDTTDIKTLNTAYMHAMTEVVNTYSDDADILTLYAAAIMNTVPWDYWDKDGNPSPNIPEAKAALEKAMRINPKHPGANHYYIHMVELPKPDLGVKSADILGDLMPGAGHMVHMPGHIYMRVGRYNDAVIANQNAILSDESYISQCYAQGLYPLGYYPHNIHFLWSAASMLGDAEMAIDAAQKTAEKVPLFLLKESPFHQNFASTPILAYLRFGKWNQVLTMPNPGPDYDYMNLIWHYARGVAFARKQNLKEAREELQFISDRDGSEDDEKLANIAKVAYEVLAGEIESTNGNLDKAIEHLENAVATEGKLPYDEPSVWYIPTRQSLGAILLKAEKFEEAERIYKEDLNYYRNNGWSLKGLQLSLAGQNKTYEAKQAEKAFEEAWSKATIEINSSVY